MNIKKYATEFADTFIKVLLVGMIMTFLSNLVIHGASVVDWETSFRLALILGIVLPWIRLRKRNQSDL